MRAILILGAIVVAACTPMTPPSPAEPGENACRASEYQHLVGQNRSAIPATPAGQTWRVTCTDCPVTMDYRGDRLNIFFDQASGRVEQVRCG